MKPIARHCAAFAVILCGLDGPAEAQLDPLLFLKTARPHVLIALDLSSRMLQDQEGSYYDPLVFERVGAPFEAALGVTDATVDRAYRRRYRGLSWQDAGGPQRAAVRSIEAVGDRQPAFAAFDSFSRLGRVRAALMRAIQGNARSVRFGLITTRRANARLPASPLPVIGTTSPPDDQPTDTGVPGQWRAGIPLVDGPASAAEAGAAAVPADAPGANERLLRLLALPPGRAGALLPAGLDGPAAAEAPLGLLLDDLRAEATRLVAGDASCCNTVAVLIAAGGDPGSSEQAFFEKAEALLNLAGRRVPIHVVAVAPRAAEAAQLRAAAAASGGRYVEITAPMLAGADVLAPLPELVNAVNAAVQHVFASFSDFNSAPSPTQPLGRPSLFPTAPPIVGTVNLENALDASGQPLRDTRVIGPTGLVVPQPANVLVTAGFEMPGFLGRLSAFRVYRPVPDGARATGYRFAADGTRLWTATAPAPDQRNIFTVLPGAGLVPFRTTSADVLAPFLGVSDPVRLVEHLRALPLGALLNSTPAVLEPPSGPFADPDYAAFVAAHQRRRSLIFVGADDGMMHAIDARTGVEVWAVVPFNLLPKLRLLPEGLPVDAFPHMVDGSPRLADVNVAGAWRTVLLFGEGPGGTFYQAFDVTLDGIEALVAPDADNVPAMLAWFSEPSRIQFRWSYPRYEQFDATSPPHGDLRASATDAEKSVGETWSTPAVGRAGGPAGPFVAIVGSGRLARSREREPQRGGTRAGTRLYLFDIASGALLDSRDVGRDGLAEEQDGCTSDSCATLKNALQADPLAVNPKGAVAVTHVYQGDLDGRLWRFDVGNGPGPPGFAGPPRLLLEAGSDQPIFGSVALLAGSAGQAYLFFGTGSDLLPRVGITSGHRLLGVAESAAGVVRQFEQVLRNAGSGGLDEGFSGAPAVDGAAVFFATTTWRGGSACTPPEAALYGLTIAGGTAYRPDGHPPAHAEDERLLARVAGGRATGPIVADRHVYLGSGERLSLFGDPEGFAAGPGFLGLRIVSWREVR